MTLKNLLRTASIVIVCMIIGLGLGCRKNATGAHDEGAASLFELNRALSLWVMTTGTLPQDLSALTNSAALKGKALPVAPPGKKLAIDVATRQVVFADQ